MHDPTEAAMRKAITWEEAARHCQRQTRGVAETEEMLESSLLSSSSATDTLCVPLLKEMTSIWEEQKQHIRCPQDPPGVSLYTITGEIKKGGVSLKTVRCARGSTSLESFRHSHITQFIPGTENHITMSYHFDSSI